MLPYTPDAEDACQEALINIANKIGSWHRNGRFTTWMHVVAVNSARTTYRRMKNQAFSSDVLPLEKPDPRTTSVIAGTRLDLLEAMEMIERDHPQFVEPLILRDVYGMSYDDIAQLLGVPARHREGADPPRPQARAAAPARAGLTVRRVRGPRSPASLACCCCSPAAASVLATPGPRRLAGTAAGAGAPTPHGRTTRR